MRNTKWSQTNMILAVIAAVLSTSLASADDRWVVYEGKQGPGRGKHIVLIAGDEEYRSEEAMPQLGKILAVHHGFKCTVLFSQNPDTGEIDPNNQKNIPGLEALKTADLMMVNLRFRNLPDEQAHAFLFAEAPRILFPFVRRVIADASRDAGFPPLMMDPMDFGALYQQQLAARAQQQGQSGDAMPTGES